MYFVKIGNGKPIVFLHGWGCDGSIFLPVAKLLPDRKCYLPDFNGFGKSPVPRVSGWNVDDYAHALEIFFRLHNIEKATLVGHSFGCRVALAFAAKNPSSVEKMLLVAPAGIRHFSFSRWCKVRSYKLRKFLCRMGFCQNLSEKTGSVDYNACEDAMKNTFVKVVNQDLSRYAKLIKAETLIINGKDDFETPLKHARELQRIIENSALSEIEGGHFAMFNNPVAFANTIRYFVED
ncbi:MAG: alpha/beta hydrolase [Corallococcus sp.]|nr:alpha/beta hydrolase [Corallococcus sp.]MCM1359226.1 alpha/beta hydrolase [Corallococcus sp.]MCM1394617.1 alpha/beta hydrolase [Corallococcus sp.]